MHISRFITVLLLFVLPSKAPATEVIPSVFVQNYTVSDYKASCQNWALSSTQEGILYVANNSGLLTFDGNSWKIHELPGQAVISQVCNTDNDIFTAGVGLQGKWLRDNYGILHYKDTAEQPIAPDKQKETPALPFSFPDKQITAVEQIDQLFFIGTARNGLFVADSTGHIQLHLTANNLLQDNQIHDLLVQQDKRLWIAMDNGLALLTLNPPILLLGERSLTGKPEQAFLKEGELFLQSNLGYFKRTLQTGDAFITLSETEAKKLFPPSASQKKLRLDNLFDNMEALGSFAGTDRIYPISENSCWLVQKNEAGLFHIENRKPLLKCRILFDNYNLNLVNRGKSFIPLNDTLHLVSTMQGVVLINSRKIVEDGLHAPVTLHITGISYADSEGNKHSLLPTDRTLSLPHSFKEITLLAGTSIFAVNRQISYLIEGISPEWSAWQRDGRINLLQLPPGDYTIRIRTYTVRGPFPEIEVKLFIRSPWYKTWWAGVGYLIVVGLLAWLATYRYIRNQKKQELERLQAERTAEQQRLQQLKTELLETELQNKNDELTRQTSAHVRKNELMQSLLEELEQQKQSLGNDYPDKMYKKLRHTIEKGLNDQEDWNAFETYFNSAHRDFTDRLRKEYPEITPGDIRVCCLLRMNLSTKEIASLLNISVRAVELRRYRLRKRIGLEGESNLTDFFMNF